MIWKPDTQGHHRADHMRAQSAIGDFVAGPRQSDGGWEFLPPDDDWQGVCESWNQAECLDAAEAWLEAS